MMPIFDGIQPLTPAGLTSRKSSRIDRKFSTKLSDFTGNGLKRLLVSDVPLCKTAAGDAVDCVAALNLTSRAAVPLAK